MPASPLDEPTKPPANPGAVPAAASGQLRSGPERADSRLVLLHGWGADADDLLDLGALLVDADVSVVALQAPGSHPSGEGRQWYDLQEPGWPGLPVARAQLLERLQQLHRDVPLERTVLLGFSQGAAMALDVATGPDDLALAGVIGCSGYPHPAWTPRPAEPGSGPVLLTHGREDPVVPYGASEELARQLGNRGHRVELIGFAGGHCIDPDLLPTLRQQLRLCWQE